MILGMLAERGPAHGHQIRRAGQLANAEAWGGITGGAIYAELRRLDADDLIRPLREEQVGKRPARTVYEITEDGHAELIVQREAALDALFPSADPVSVVFAAGAEGAGLDERLAGRRRSIQRRLESMVDERTRLTAGGMLPPMAVAAFRRGELRLEAELRWHEEFETAGGGAVRPGQGPPTAPSRRDRRTGPPAPAEAGT